MLIEYPKNKTKVQRIIQRSGIDYKDILPTVGSILEAVKKGGDKALFECTKKFDNFDLNEKNIRISREEVKRAYKNVSPDVVKSLKYAYRNIKKYHEEQFRRIIKNWSFRTENGVNIEEKIRPIDSIGCYIPGGLASYPSTVLMTCIPAKVSGVKRIVIVSPPPIKDVILVAADICGIDKIYRVGGVQAIGALAYGTNAILNVSKIVGPGNKYVMAAKNLVYGTVDIDMPAGPSEVLIIADNSSNPDFIAADLLAQAEHDTDASCVLVIQSESIIKKVESRIGKQRKTLKRRKILEKSLNKIAFVLARDMKDAIKFANEFAPEHLEIMTKNPEKVADKIENAGTIFLGLYGTVAAGDYSTGANHVLPTSGAARFSSQLSVRDFLKTSSIQKINKGGLGKLRETIGILSDVEGFDAHKKSVEIRFE